MRILFVYFPNFSQENSCNTEQDINPFEIAAPEFLTVDSLHNEDENKNVNVV